MSERNETRTTATDWHGDAVSGLPVLPPLAAVIEVVVLVVLPGIFDLFVPAFPTLNEMQPHFYWLPVLLLTLQYGSASGLLAAGTAIVLSSLLGWPEQEIGENHFSYLLRIWLQPVLWLGVAVILGQFRLRQIERKQALSRAVAELSDQRQSLADHAQRLRERCDRLERIVSTRRGPDARDMLAALGRVEAGDPDQAPRALVEILALGFGSSTISVYALDGASLRLAFRHAPSGAAAAPELIGPESPLHAAVVGDGRTIDVLTRDGERDLDGRGLAAAPIITTDGRVEGVVLLESGEPDDLDTGTADRLHAVAALVSGRFRPLPDTGRAVPPAVPYGESHISARDGRWQRTRWQSGRHQAGTARAGRKAGS